jgi:hypothetical protein
MNKYSFGIPNIGGGEDGDGDANGKEGKVRCIRLTTKSRFFVCHICIYTQNSMKT